MNNLRTPTTNLATQAKLDELELQLQGQFTGRVAALFGRRYRVARIYAHLLPQTTRSAGRHESDRPADRGQ